MIEAGFPAALPAFRSTAPTAGPRPGRVPFLAVVILLLAAQTGAEVSSSTLVPFQLKDQHEALHTEARFSGAPLVVLWGDRQGSKFMKRWSTLLADSLRMEVNGGELRRLDVAHTRGAPFFIKGRIRKAFRRDWPDPVLLDWEGIFAKAYGCPGDSCTIFLFDGQGALTRRWTVTDPDPDRAGSILASVRLVAGSDRGTK